MLPCPLPKPQHVLRKGSPDAGLLNRSLHLAGHAGTVTSGISQVPVLDNVVNERLVTENVAYQIHQGAPVTEQTVNNIGKQGDHRHLESDALGVQHVLNVLDALC